MKLSRIQLFIAVFIVLISPFIIYRIIWLKRSVPTKGVVLYTNHTIMTVPRQNYPVIQFKTDQYSILVSGHYNAPYNDGDTVQLRYIKDNPTNFLVDTFWNYWIGTFIWAGFLVLFAFFLLFRNIVPNKTFLITRYGLKPKI